jgi:hypothetical protein
MSAVTCSEVRERADEYVLHTLEPAIEAAIREHLAAHPDGHPEYAELSRVAPAIAYLADPIDPPARLKAKVLAAAAGTAQLGAVAATAGAAPLAGVVAAPPAREVPPLYGGWRTAFTARRMAIAGWATAAVAIAVAVALVFAGVQFAPNSSGNGTAERLQRAMSLAAAPGSRIAVIGSPASSANGLAVIPRSGAGIVVMQGLAPTTGSEVYEVWAIVGSQAPAPIGSFAVGADRSGGLDGVTVPPGESVTVALTREPGPGATKPTLPIVASGAAG